MYTWGNGADGALGHGDTASVSYPRVVEHFFGMATSQNQYAGVAIVGVAAGADVLGSHSAAVSADGRVFSWGLGTALGQGTSQVRGGPDA